MTLKRLSVASLRNIQTVNLPLNPRFNCFHGPNGSGKSSVLEAVYILSSGRSFRTSTRNSLIRRGDTTCTLFTQVQSQSRSVTHSLGAQFERGGKRTLHLDGETCHSQASMSWLLPVVNMGPGSLLLVEGPPGQRRRFLNWGAFHVEQSFGSQWIAAQQSLRQRNVLLKSGAKSDLPSWTQQFVRHALAVTEARQAYFAEFKTQFEQVIQQLMPGQELTLTYKPGWPENLTLSETLSKESAREFQRGHTLYGHQRADLEIRSSGAIVNGLLSRGELKLIAWAMLITQGLFYNQRGSGQSIFLVDDLGAELDRTNCHRVCEILEASGSQVLLTSLDSQLFGDLPSGGRTMFHVEQGVIKAG